MEHTSFYTKNHGEFVLTLTTNAQGEYVSLRVGLR
jgi:hypothetical protein